MADFVLSTMNKMSVRKLPAPIADAATFNGAIKNILTNSPWECTSWEGGGGEFHRERQSLLRRLHPHLVRISSYENDMIETWADEVAAFA